LFRSREMARQLVELGDPVRGDELEGRLKTARQDGLRGLRDRAEIFEGGENVLRLGTHRFSVSTQALELTVLPRDGGLSLNILGTDFSEPITDPEILKRTSRFDQLLVSESPEVYRAEYLAGSILFDAEEQQNGLSVPRSEERRVGKQGGLRWESR